MPFNSELSCDATSDCITYYDLLELIKSMQRLYPVPDTVYINPETEIEGRTVRDLAKVGELPPNIKMTKAIDKDIAYQVDSSMLESYPRSLYEWKYSS